MKLIYLTEEIKVSLINEIKSPDVIIDSGIEDYINKINEFPFINTTQCCQGHPNGGYLSVMVTKGIKEWFENDLIPNMSKYCEDIAKRFENVEDKLIVRYLFLFKEGFTDMFFRSLIEQLSRW